MKQIVIKHYLYEYELQTSFICWVYEYILKGLLIEWDKLYSIAM